MDVQSEIAVDDGAVVIDELVVVGDIEGVGGVVNVSDGEAIRRGRRPGAAVEKEDWDSIVKAKDGEARIATGRKRGV